MELRTAVVACLAAGCASDAPPCRSAEAPPLLPTYEGADADRTQVPVALVQVAARCGDISDLAVAPDGALLVATRSGVVHAVGGPGPLARLDVAGGGTRGLVALALHPGFADNGRAFASRTVRAGAEVVLQVVELAAGRGGKLSVAQVLFTVEQPWSQGVGGDLLFAEDGRLLVGVGDGGGASDPLGHAQNAATALGSVLRVDVDGDDAWGVPEDNPFAGDDRALHQVWATGVRRPMLAAAGEGRIVLTDPGLHDVQEVGWLTRAGNHGWPMREGRDCLPLLEPCRGEDLVEPFLELRRDDARALLGGVVGPAGGPEELRGRYVFGDRELGRLWAVDLPEPGARAAGPLALGRFWLRPTAFAADAESLYVATDASGGSVYRVVPLTEVEPRSASGT